MEHDELVAAMIEVTLSPLRLIADELRREVAVQREAEKAAQQEAAEAKTVAKLHVAECKVFYARGAYKALETTVRALDGVTRKVG